MKKYIRIIIPVLIFVAAAAFILFLPDGSSDGGCEDGNHSYTVENVCSECGDVWEYTEGLHFAVYEDGYQFTGIPSELKPNVKDLVIPYGYNGKFVVAIGEMACDDNTNIESVTVPSSVKLIYSSAFSNCSNLKNINLPDVPLRIWSSFNGTAFVNDESNWDDGTLYIGKHLIGVKSEKSGKLKIKDGTLSIATYLIHYNGFNPGAIAPEISAVNVPNSVKVIEGRAFAGWKNLKSINLPDDLEYIGNKILDNTGISDSKWRWSKGMFYYDGYLLQTESDAIEPVCQIRSGTKLIAAGVFWNNANVREVIIPNSVKAILQETFGKCAALEKVRLPKDVKSLGAGVFQECAALKEIELPENLEIIGQKAFYYCTALESVTMGDNVKGIYSGAFTNCTALKSINMSNSLKAIGDYAFFKCELLKSVKLSEGLESIGEYAFYSCASLERIDIPNGIKVIPMACFAGCESISAVTLPEGLEEIGLSGFNSTVITEIKLPQGLKTIKSGAFSGCNALKEIVIPESVIGIGGHAFSRCESITTITIPQNVDKIEDSLFWGCTSLKEVYVQGKVTSIGDSAFSGCTALEKVELQNNDMTFGKKVFEDTALCKNESNLDEGGMYIGTTLVAVKEDASGKFTVKEGTTFVTPGVFEGIQNIMEIVIPNSVTSIGVATFKYCKGLEKVTLPKQLSDIPYECFYGCEKLTEVSIPQGVTIIHDNAFYGCSSLEAIEIPTSVTKIGLMTFQECSSLKAIEIPFSVVSIGSCAFWECTSLEKVVISAQLEIINNSTFNGCTSLTEINIPSSVKTIYFSAFEGCTALKKIMLSDGLEKIGDKVFSGCTALESIRIPKSVQSIGKNAFLDTFYYNNKTNWNGNVLYLDGWLINIKEATAPTLEVKAGTIGIASELFDKIKIKKIIIPASVVYIGDKCFDNCYELTEAVFEDPNGWETTYNKERYDLSEQLIDPQSAATALKNGDYKQWFKTVEKKG